jgi:DNA-binding SARP family transcriptional activator
MKHNFAKHSTLAALSTGKPGNSVRIRRFGRTLAEHVERRGRRAVREYSVKIDTALAEWERRFESASPGTMESPVSAVGHQGTLRGFLEQEALIPASPSLQTYDADIAARVLGPLELSIAGMRVLRWKSLKARAIFQYLLIHQGRPVRREVLMELEWPDHSRNSARNNLNVALYCLRNTLACNGLDAQTILHKEGCYFLNPALKYWIDHNEFLTMIHDAQRARRVGSIQQAIDASRSAIQLYGGPLFEDDLAGEWYLAERRHTQELYLQALEFLAQTYCDLGQLLTAIEFGQRAISADPCYEGVHRLLMRCYARQHQQQLVGRQYQLCTSALREELGVSPAAETVQLFDALTSNR